MKRVVLVNGVPACGKSQVSRALADRTGWPILTLDSVKEPFFDQLGVGDREFNRALGRASYAAIFRILADAPGGFTAIVDAWFGFQPVEVLERHLARAGIEAHAEIWCHAPSDVLVARYERRLGQRHAGHPGAAFLPELVALNERARPLRLGPSFDHDGTEPVAMPALLAFLGDAGFPVPAAGEADAGPDDLIPATAGR